MFPELPGEVSGKACAAAFAAFLNNAYHGLLDHHVPEELAALAGRICCGSERPASSAIG